MIRDENGSPMQAPVDYVRIFALEFYKKNSYRLFERTIVPGYFSYSEQYSCQQLTCVLDALTYHSYLIQKVISRKYESEIGFYFVKLFVENEWKEIVLDDLIPVFKSNQMPVFSNSASNDLAWVLVFKAFAKLSGALNYFETEKEAKAEYYLTHLTGMPSMTIKVINEIINNQEEYNEKVLMKPTQATKILEVDHREISKNVGPNRLSQSGNLVQVHHFSALRISLGGHASVLAKVLPGVSFYSNEVAFGPKRFENRNQRPLLLRENGQALARGLE